MKKEVSYVPEIQFFPGLRGSHLSSRAAQILTPPPLRESLHLEQQVITS